MPNRPRVASAHTLRDSARLSRGMEHGFAVDEFQAAQLIVFVLVMAALLIGMEIGMRRQRRH